MAIARARARDTAERDLVLAWHVAALSRQKRLPTLKKLLGSGKPALSRRTQHQTPQQMKSVLEMLGYKAKPLSEEAKRATRWKVS